MVLKGRQEVQLLLFNSNINVMTCNFRKDGFLLKPLINGFSMSYKDKWPLHTSEFWWKNQIFFPV